MSRLVGELRRVFGDPPVAPRAVVRVEVGAGQGLAEARAEADRLVDAGVMPAERRPGAEFLAWSAVHGLAMLIIDGPLRGLPRAQTDALGQRLSDMVEEGL